jgi:branched-chain amino acid transport system substrate-binding protein
VKYARCMVLVVLGLMLVSPTSAQEPIKVGFMYILSGRAAFFGQMARQGAELAIEQVNAEGGINGRKLVGIFEDTEGKPEKGVQLAKRFAQEDRVDAIMGIISSGVAEAVSPVAAELKKPLIITTATTPVVTGAKCNKYTFRITWTTDQSLQSAAILASGTNAKRWTTVGPDYLLGHETWELFSKYLGQLSPQVAFLPKSDVVFAPMTTSDWEPHIKKVIDSKADGIVVSLWGGNAIDFVKQAGQLGLFDGSRTILFNVAGSLDFFLGLGSQMPEGIWVGAPYWFEASSDAEANKSFILAYQDRFRAPPSYMAATAYTGVMAFCNAVKKAGQNNPEAVVAALERLELESPMGKIQFRPEDHQALYNIVWGRTGGKPKRIGERSVLRGLDKIVLFPPEKVLPSAQESGCQMK